MITRKHVPFAGRRAKQGGAYPAVNGNSARFRASRHGSEYVRAARRVFAARPPRFRYLSLANLMTYFRKATCARRLGGQLSTGFSLSTTHSHGHREH
jgi:hypothetical protein